MTCVEVGIRRGSAGMPWWQQIDIACQLGT